MFLSVVVCKIRTFSLKENKIMWVYKSMFAFNLLCLVRRWKNKKFARYFTLFLLNRLRLLRQATLLAASQTWSFGIDKDHSTFQTVISNCRSQWPRDLRRGFAAALFLGLWVRIPLEEWMFVSCECCIFSGRGLCVELITNQEKSYRVWYVWMWLWVLDNEEALTH